MKICVFGAGAVGGHIAARLAARGHDVSVVARGAHLDAMRDKGIKLLSGDAVIAGKVRAGAAGPQDAVFVTLKANLLGVFADAAAPLLRPDTAVVFAQNGIPWWYGIGRNAPELSALDPGGKLARTIKADQVVGGVVYSANEVIEPGVILNKVPGNNMLPIGELDDRDTPRIRQLRKILEDSGMSSPPVPDIRAAVWAKLLQNLAGSTLCLLAEATVKDTISDPHLRPLRDAIGREARAIAHAHGIRIESAPQRPGGGHFAGAIAHKPSLLQDYERGRPMEIEAQLVAPLAFARAANVATPILDALVALAAFKACAKGLYFLQQSGGQNPGIGVKPE